MARKKKPHPGKGIKRKARKRAQRYAHRRDGRITARHTLTRILNRFDWGVAKAWLEREGRTELILDVIRRNTRGMNAETKNAWAARRGVPVSLLG